MSLLQTGIFCYKTRVFFAEIGLLLAVRKSIKMNKLKNDIEAVKTCICQTRREFLVVRRDVMKLDKHQEGIEHQISTLQENYTSMDKRLMTLEKYVYNMASHLNGAIERINTLHMYLKEKEEEEEFDFDDFDPIFEKMQKQ